MAATSSPSGPHDSGPHLSTLPRDATAQGQQSLPAVDPFVPSSGRLTGRVVSVEPLKGISHRDSAVIANSPVLLSSPSSSTAYDQYYSETPVAKHPHRSSSGSADTATSQSSSFIAFPSPVKIYRSDPEKGRIMPSRADSETSSANSDHDDTPRVVNCLSDEQLRGHAVKTLLYFSAPNVLVSFAVLGLSILSAILIVLAAPFACLSGMATFREHAIGLLAGPLKLQLCFIRSRVESESYSIIRLWLTNLFSPFYAMPLAFAAWVSAFFWIYTLILGDPTGTDRPKDDDGKAAVLWVRKTWMQYLSWPVR